MHIYDYSHDIYVTEAWFTCEIKFHKIILHYCTYTSDFESCMALDFTNILEPKSNYEYDTYAMSFQNETFKSFAQNKQIYRPLV